MRSSIILLLICVVSHKGQAQDTLAKIYVGLEKIYDADPLHNQTSGTPANRKYQPYHLTYISFKGDSIFLEQIPVSIYKRDTIYSTPDGGFYSYIGKTTEEQGKTKANLTLQDCNNCPMKMIQFTSPQAITGNNNDMIIAGANASDAALIKARRQKVRNKVLIIEKTKKVNAISVNGITYHVQNITN
jgi:hypothetical protein